MNKKGKQHLWCKVRTFWFFTCIVACGILIYSVEQQAVFNTSRNIGEGANVCRSVCREKYIIDKIHNISETLAVKALHRSPRKKKVKVSENGNSSKLFADKALRFIYSESAVTTTANVIHLATQNNVNIGNGPCRQSLPKCIIVGNFKCGTRELIDFMSMHPRIVIKGKPVYEVPFFDVKYNKGLEWYRRHMPCSYSNQITVVKTPSYFQHPLVPARIHKMDSSIKLIVLVREPVSRTLSQFTFHKRGLRKYRSNLKSAVFSKHLNSINKSSYYVKHSVYDEGMERYLKYFNLSQIKVIETEDFINDPFAVLRDLEEFLDIEHTIRPENIVFNSEKGFHCLRQSSTSRAAACYQSNRGRNSSEVANMIKGIDDVIDRLKDFFKPHNERFFRLVGRAFDWDTIKNK